MKQKKEKSYLTTVETAELLLVSTETIRLWAQKGALRAQMTAGGHRRYFVKDIEEFASARGLTLNKKPDQESRKPKILVVDDDPGVVKMIFEFIKLNCEDLEVDSASNGFEAGQKIFRFKPSMVILDIMMPGISGVDVCKEIKSSPDTRDIKIVAITGYYTSDVVSSVKEAGADVCLSKPIKLDELKKTITMHCIDPATQKI